MARGEGRHGEGSGPADDGSPPLLRSITRLLVLIGGLKGPGYSVRLWASFGLTLQSLRCFPLVLADDQRH